MKYYTEGNLARKLEYEPKQQVTRKKTVKVSKKQSDLRYILYILVGFVMVMTVTLRYNMITEKNLNIQKAKDKLGIIESNIASVKIDMDSDVNLTEIESYAKQKLGMQKPDSSQIVYIDNVSDSSVVKGNNENFFTYIINYVKNIIN